MARPQKRTVDYFPHFVHGGKTIFILESKFGNDGYAFWFKLLEILCSTDGHVFDCNNAANWEFLMAKTRVNEEFSEKIINTLVALGKIDPELWEKRLIWVENLVQNVEDVYRTRRTVVPTKPTFSTEENPNNDDILGENPNNDDILDDKNPQSKVKESKVKKSIEKKDKKENSFSLPTIEEVESYVKEKAYHIDATSFVAFYDSKGWMIGKNRMKDWRKAVVTWESRWRQEHPQAQIQAAHPNVRLGEGEYINEQGNRTYGSGRVIIPMDAPPRPDSGCYWNAINQTWAS